jgi:hypothetical protein
VQVQRHVERLAGLEDRPALGVVHVETLRVRIDDHTLQAERLDGALDLARRGLGRVRRHRGQRSEAARMLAHRCGHLVVAGDRQLHRGVGVEQLHARAGERQDREIDAGGVHVGQAAAVEILQPLDEVARTACRAAPEEAPQAAESRVVVRAVLQHLDPAVQDLGRRPGLLGGDAAVRSGGSGVGHAEALLGRLWRIDRSTTVTVSSNAGAAIVADPDAQHRRARRCGSAGPGRQPAARCSSVCQPG